MPLYESVFIIRQDVASSDVDKITDGFSAIVTDNGGSVLKTEYWGLRTLAYEINNNKKGHYTLLGLDASPEVVAELERKMKLHGDVIRFATVRAEEINDKPSPILSGRNEEDTVDVTVNNDLHKKS